MAATLKVLQEDEEEGSDYKHKRRPRLYRREDAFVLNRTQETTLSPRWTFLPGPGVSVKQINGKRFKGSMCDRPVPTTGLIHPRNIESSELQSVKTERPPAAWQMPTDARTRMHTAGFLLSALLAASFNNSHLGIVRQLGLA